MFLALLICQVRRYLTYEVGVSTFRRTKKSFVPSEAKVPLKRDTPDLSSRWQSLLVEDVIILDRVNNQRMITSAESKNRDKRKVVMFGRLFGRKKQMSYKVVASLIYDKIISNKDYLEGIKKAVKEDLLSDGKENIDNKNIEQECFFLSTFLVTYCFQRKSCRSTMPEGLVDK